MGRTRKEREIGDLHPHAISERFCWVIDGEPTFGGTIVPVAATPTVTTACAVASMPTDASAADTKRKRYISER